MKNTFITGSFLRGYNSVFRYRQPENTSRTPSFSMEDLSKRFSERAARVHRKGAGYITGLQTGMAAGLVLLLVAFTVPFSPDSKFEVVQVEQELVTMEEIQQTKQQIQPPPPPRPIIPVMVPDDELIVDEDLELDAALELDEMLVDLGPPPAEEEEEEDTDEVFVVVESMPKMIGGMAKLSQAVKYPVIARKQGIEGNVIVKIVVDTDGKPGSPVILRSPSPLLEEAAVKAVMAQRFEPGKQRGRAVKVEVVIPVKFRLTAS
ncbi:MAG: energy transducer TonB [Bacteroidota bacterium]